MRTISIKIFSLAAMVVLLTSCLTSVHPLYKQEDIKFDTRMLGAWSQMTVQRLGENQEISFSSEGTWIFMPNTEEADETPDHYRLLHIGEANDSAYFKVHLFTLDGEQFLDLYPDEVGVSNIIASMTIFPTHLFARVAVQEGKLSLNFFNGDWLVKLIEENRIRIKQETVDGSVLLTASTEELQKFVVKYKDEPKAFGDEVVLTPAP